MVELGKSGFVLVITLAALAPTFVQGQGKQNQSTQHQHAQHDHRDAHGPQHGGIVVEASNVDLELVVRASLAQLHLRDHGKVLDVSKASAKLTLLAGEYKQEVTLAPVENRLEARGTFATAPGTKAVVVMRIAGRAPVTARFVLK